MKPLISIILIAFAAANVPAPAADNEAITKARAAANSWLLLTDSSQFSKSWEEAAAYFRAAVTQADWEKSMKAHRSPLGAMKARKVKSATFARSLPGAPDGEYVVIQFDTQFENKASAVETVTPMREKDGSWRVSGYYIK